MRKSIRMDAEKLDQIAGNPASEAGLGAACARCGLPRVAGVIVEDAACQCGKPCDTQIQHGEIKARIAAAELALAKHTASAFHEKSPCGGCHFWQGYIAGLTDLGSGQWHMAMRPNDKLARAAAPKSEQ